MKAQRILVVDDESSIRDTLRRYLHQAGHRVETAPDGIEALQTVEEGAFDIVITDLNMPRMGGVELVKRLKEYSPQTITIVLTGHGSLDSAVAVLHQGCDDYLLKPLNNFELIAHSIDRCLSRRNGFMMAASARKVSEAKDNVLALVVEEFESRLVELRGHADRLEKNLAAVENRKDMEIAATMKAKMAQLTAILADVKTAHHTIRERSTGN